MERTCDISPGEPSDGGFLVEPAPRPDRAIIVAGTALLIVGFLGILIGEFGCSVGRIGVLCWIAGSLGIFFAGLCLLCFAVFMFRHMVRKAAGQRILTKENVRGAAVELGVIFLNVLIYGGCAIIALGALTAMDSAPFIALPVIAFAILGFASYRIYRKRHPFPYEYTSKAWVVVVLAILGIFMVPIGMANATSGIADLAEGPQTAVVELLDLDVNRPTGRYAGIRTTDYIARFGFGSKRDFTLIVKAQDKEALMPLTETRGLVTVTYYPNSQRLVRIER